jgi:hypothetical protein
MTVGLGVVLDQRQVAAATAAVLADPSVEELVQKLEAQSEHHQQQQQLYLGQSAPAAACGRLCMQLYVTFGSTGAWICSQLHCEGAAAVVTFHAVFCSLTASVPLFEVAPCQEMCGMIQHNIVDLLLLVLVPVTSAP